MAHLIPEKRVDKNGKLVTRRVKTADTTGKAPVLPPPAVAAPKAPKLKKPTKKQTELHYRTPYGVGLSDVDQRLREHLTFAHAGKAHDLYHMSTDEQLYDVLSVTDPVTTMAVLKAGMKDSREVEYLLANNGMEDLLQDNREFTTEAFNRRIPAESLVNRIKTFDRARHSPHFLDALEASGIKALDDYQSVYFDILQGEVRLSDVKTVGASRINRSQIGWEGVERPLKELAEGDTKYTAEDLVVLLNYGAGEFDAGLEVVREHGGEMIQGVANPYLARTLCRQFRKTEEDASPERIKSVVDYGDKIWSGTSYSQNRVSPSDIPRFHDAGIDADDVIEGRITVRQLEGMEEHGISSSVSDGWL